MVARTPVPFSIRRPVAASSRSSRDAMRSFKPSRSSFESALSLRSVSGGCDEIADRCRIERRRTVDGGKDARLAVGARRQARSSWRGTPSTSAPEAMTRPIITACTTQSAARNMPSTERSRRQRRRDGRNGRSCGRCDGWRGDRRRLRRGSRWGARRRGRRRRGSRRCGRRRCSRGRRGNGWRAAVAWKSTGSTSEALQPAAAPFEPGRAPAGRSERQADEKRACDEASLRYDGRDAPTDAATGHAKSTYRPQLRHQC